MLYGMIREYTFASACSNARESIAYLYDFTFGEAFCSKKLVPPFQRVEDFVEIRFRQRVKFIKSLHELASE